VCRAPCSSSSTHGCACVYACVCDHVSVRAPWCAGKPCQTASRTCPWWVGGCACVYACVYVSICEYVGRASRCPHLGALADLARALPEHVRDRPQHLCIRPKASRDPSRSQSRPLSKPVAIPLSQSEPVGVYLRALADLARPLPEHVRDRPRTVQHRLAARVASPRDLMTKVINNYFTEMCRGSEAGSYLRLIDLCITQL